MLGVFALGSEYSWDTLKTLFTQRPGRLRVFAAKLAALGDRPRPVRARAVRGRRGGELRDRADRGRARRLAVGVAAACARSAAGWLILAAWAALGVLLGVLTRGTSLAIGVGILYALVIEGLLSAFTDSVSALEPLDAACSCAPTATRSPTALGASSDAIASNGPGSFGGPFVGSPPGRRGSRRAVGGFAAVAALVLRRRDVE